MLDNPQSGAIYLMWRKSAKGGGFALSQIVVGAVAWGSRSLHFSQQLGEQTNLSIVSPGGLFKIKKPIPHIRKRSEK